MKLRVLYRRVFSTVKVKVKSIFFDSALQIEIDLSIRLFDLGIRNQASSLPNNNSRDLKKCHNIIGFFMIFSSTMVKRCKLWSLMYPFLKIPSRANILKMLN